MPVRDRLGTELSTFGAGGSLGLDPTFTVISGPRVVAENVARRWLTPLGTLPGDEDDVADFGFDVRSFLGAKLTPLAKARLRDQLVRQALKDERVKNADVTVEEFRTPEGSAGLRIVGVITVETNRQMRLTLSVDALRSSVQFEAV